MMLKMLQYSFPVNKMAFSFSAISFYIKGAFESCEEPCRAEPPYGGPAESTTTRFRTSGLGSEEASAFKRDEDCSDERRESSETNIKQKIIALSQTILGEGPYKQDEMEDYVQNQQLLKKEMLSRLGYFSLSASDLLYKYVLFRCLEGLGDSVKDMDVYDVIVPFISVTTPFITSLRNSRDTWNKFVNKFKSLSEGFDEDYKQDISELVKTKEVDVCILMNANRLIKHIEEKQKDRKFFPSRNHLSLSNLIEKVNNHTPLKEELLGKMRSFLFPVVDSDVDDFKHNSFEPLHEIFSAKLNYYLGLEMVDMGLTYGVFQYFMGKDLSIFKEEDLKDFRGFVRKKLNYQTWWKFDCIFPDAKSICDFRREHPLLGFEAFLSEVAAKMLASGLDFWDFALKTKDVKDVYGCCKIQSEQNLFKAVVWFLLERGRYLGAVKSLFGEKGEKVRNVTNMVISATVDGQYEPVYSCFSNVLDVGNREVDDIIARFKVYEKESGSKTGSEELSNEMIFYYLSMNERSSDFDDFIRLYDAQNKCNTDTENERLDSFLVDLVGELGKFLEYDCIGYKERKLIKICQSLSKGGCNEKLIQYISALRFCLIDRAWKLGDHIIQSGNIHNDVVDSIRQKLNEISSSSISSDEACKLLLKNNPDLSRYNYNNAYHSPKVSELNGLLLSARNSIAPPDLSSLLSEGEDDESEKFSKIKGQLLCVDAVYKDTRYEEFLKAVGCEGVICVSDINAIKFFETIYGFYNNNNNNNNNNNKSLSWVWGKISKDILPLGFGSLSLINMVRDADFQRGLSVNNITAAKFDLSSVRSKFAYNKNIEDKLLLYAAKNDLCLKDVKNLIMILSYLNGCRVVSGDVCSFLLSFNIGIDTQNTKKITIQDQVYIIGDVLFRLLRLFPASFVVFSGNSVTLTKTGYDFFKSIVVDGGNTFSNQAGELVGTALNMLRTIMGRGDEKAFSVVSNAIRAFHENAIDSSVLKTGLSDLASASNNIVNAENCVITQQYQMIVLGSILELQKKHKNNIYIFFVLKCLEEKFFQAQDQETCLSISDVLTLIRDLQYDKIFEGVKKLFDDENSPFSGFAAEEFETMLQMFNIEDKSLSVEKKNNDKNKYEEMIQNTKKIIRHIDKYNLVYSDKKNLQDSFEMFEKSLNAQKKNHSKHYVKCFREKYVTEISTDENESMPEFTKMNKDARAFFKEISNILEKSMHNNSFQTFMFCLMKLLKFLYDFLGVRGTNNLQELCNIQQDDVFCYEKCVNAISVLCDSFMNHNWSALVEFPAKYNIALNVFHEMCLIFKSFLGQEDFKNSLKKYFKSVDVNVDVLSLLPFASLCSSYQKEDVATFLEKLIKLNNSKNTGQCTGGQFALNILLSFMFSYGLGLGIHDKNNVNAHIFKILNEDENRKEENTIKIESLVQQLIKPITKETFKFLEDDSGYGDLGELGKKYREIKKEDSYLSKENFNKSDLNKVMDKKILEYLTKVYKLIEKKDTDIKLKTPTNRYAVLFNFTECKKIFRKKTDGEIRTLCILAFYYSMKYFEDKNIIDPELINELKGFLQDCADKKCLSEEEFAIVYNYTLDIMNSEEKQDSSISLTVQEKINKIDNSIKQIIESENNDTHFYSANIDRVYLGMQKASKNTPKQDMLKKLIECFGVPNSLQGYDVGLSSLNLSIGIADMIQQQNIDNLIDAKLKTGQLFSELYSVYGQNPKIVAKILGEIKETPYYTVLSNISLTLRSLDENQKTKVLEFARKNNKQINYYPQEYLDSSILEVKAAYWEFLKCLKTGRSFYQIKQHFNINYQLPLNDLKGCILAKMFLEEIKPQVNQLSAEIQFYAFKDLYDLLLKKIDSLAEKYKNNLSLEETFRTNLVKLMTSYLDISNINKNIQEELTKQNDGDLQNIMIKLYIINNNSSTKPASMVELDKCFDSVAQTLSNKDLEKSYEDGKAKVKLSLQISKYLEYWQNLSVSCINIQKSEQNFSKLSQSLIGSKGSKDDNINIFQKYLSAGQVNYQFIKTQPIPLLYSTLAKLEQNITTLSQNTQKELSEAIKKHLFNIEPNKSCKFLANCLDQVLDAYYYLQNKHQKKPMSDELVFNGIRLAFSVVNKILNADIKTKQFITMNDLVQQFEKNKDKDYKYFGVTRGALDNIVKSKTEIIKKISEISGEPIIEYVTYKSDQKQETATYKKAIVAISSVIAVEATGNSEIVKKIVSQKTIETGAAAA